MLLTDDLDFCRFLELVHGNHFTVVIERSDSRDVAAPDVDEAVRVKRAIVVADIQRAVGEHDLHVWIEDAVVIRQLEPALQRECLSGSDISQPHNRTGHTSTCMVDALEGERVTTGRDIGAGSHNAIGRERSVEVNGSVNGSARCDANHLVRLRRGGDDSGTWSNAAGTGVRIVARMG